MRTSITEVAAIHSRKYFVHGLLAVLLPVLTSGCIAIKNQAPLAPDPSQLAQWRTRYSSSVWVRVPIEEQLRSATNSLEHDWKVESARLNARRLAETLEQCRLFKEVVVSDSASGTNVVVIEALPNSPSYADPDAAWLLLYGGLIPLYVRVDEGVRFRFVNGEGNDFVFPWTEQSVIGFWAPFAAAVGHGWRFGVGSRPEAPDSPYWAELRYCLIKAMDQIEELQR